ncbi:MAG: hotdog family protein [Planctomycetota bacterium]|jgi:3-hydroxyacyl-[acyl-carrier-protein] dehydratase
MRYVLIDRFLELEKGERARAVKCVTRGEPFVRELAAYPSALVLEALLQTGGVLARSGSGFTQMSVLGKVERAEFPAQAHPGDRILLDVTAVLSRPEGTLCEGVATVDGAVVARAEFMIVFVPPDMIPPPDPQVTRHRQELMRALAIPSEDS